MNVHDKQGRENETRVKRKQEGETRHGGREREQKTRRETKT